MHGNIIEMSSQKYGRWFVLERLLNNKAGAAYWKCKCDCGTVKYVSGYSLRNGLSTSCGCLRDKLRIKHNLSRSRIYKVWASMIQRCHNINDRGYCRYGKRGIYVCDKWRYSFSCFFKDMGARPPGCTIERIDNNIGYMPTNCRWDTHHNQSRNMSSNVNITYHGSTKCLTDWALDIGITYRALYRRISTLGIERAFSVPKHRKHKAKTYTYKGKNKTIIEWSRDTGISSSLLYDRIGRGWNIKRAIEEKKHNNSGASRNLCLKTQ